ncbi:hypothetical protein D9615_000795 [Tricholomella constricta]|uniref:S-adenosyl-L-methionine-dependent methyltransferase n=1 Tax=Tricholomella constricta TaxID=117010 RepID=A0A8H5HSG2_9AGAR|nr:hypothetical protein D9615_000795 [Tricholomella constricta]
MDLNGKGGKPVCFIFGRSTIDFVHRLDKLHNGIAAYLHGELSLATIENPKKILDVGAGSGAWAIQAAQLYPDAEVIAADLAQLPARPLPKNVSYLPLDVLKPYPSEWEQEIFDVIHLRLVLYHLPQAAIGDVLRRTVGFLKPNGWLLIEDVGLHSGHQSSPGPAQHAVNSIFLEMQKSRDLDPLIGEHLEEYLQDTGAFSEVNIQREQLVLTTDLEAAGPSPEIRAFSDALRSTLENIMRNEIGEDLKARGVTEEMRLSWLQERGDPTYKTYHDFWFTWSRKSGRT